MVDSSSPRKVRCDGGLDKGDGVGWNGLLGWNCIRPSFRSPCGGGGGGGCE